MTQAVLAERSGLSLKYVSRLENGRKGIPENPSLNVLEAIAKSLSTTPGCLLGDEKDPRPLLLVTKGPKEKIWDIVSAMDAKQASLALRLVQALREFDRI